MDRVDVEPKLLRWARERAGLRVDALAGRFPRIEAWERGEIRPTLKQLERFARATHTPVGCLFLREPPVERIPIADFRAGTGSNRGRPSANLLDTIYLCQQRQNWYREFARTAGEGSIGFVGSGFHRERRSGDCGSHSSVGRVRGRGETTVPDVGRCVEGVRRAGGVTWRSGLGERRGGQQQSTEAGCPRVPRIRLGGFHRAHDFHQWRGHEGRSDVHPRA